MKQIICAKCNTNLESDIKFCPSCGTKVSTGMRSYDEVEQMRGRIMELAKTNLPNLEGSAALIEMLITSVSLDTLAWAQGNVIDDRFVRKFQK